LDSCNYFNCQNNFNKGWRHNHVLKSNTCNKLCKRYVPINIVTPLTCIFFSNHNLFSQLMVWFTSHRQFINGCLALLSNEKLTSCSKIHECNLRRINLSKFLSFTCWKIFSACPLFIDNELEYRNMLLTTLTNTRRSLLPMTKMGVYRLIATTNYSLSTHIYWINRNNLPFWVVRYFWSTRMRNNKDDIHTYIY
jgi:hypothetical protein